MKLPPRYRLSEAEKDALLLEQAALIERMATRIATLEAALAKTEEDVVQLAHTTVARWS